MRQFSLALYYIILNKLPHSTIPFFGPFSERLKEFFAKRIFKYCGSNVNIGRGARFGNGRNIEIGDNSGIGMNAKVPNDIKIGKDVMMGVNVTIFGGNHVFESTDIPMRLQGMKKLKPVVIEDDVWIGNNVIILAGRVISKGTIVAAGAVVTKDFPPFSIIGGNPAKFIKSRLESQ